MQIVGIIGSAYLYQCVLAPAEQQRCQHYSGIEGGERHAGVIRRAHRLTFAPPRVEAGKADRGERDRPRQLLAVGQATIIETNRIGAMPQGPLTAKVRSMAMPVPVTLEGAFGDNATATIRFHQPEYGVAPGQAAVIYAGERVVGGGWIDTTSAV